MFGARCSHRLFWHLPKASAIANIFKVRSYTIIDADICGSASAGWKPCLEQSTSTLKPLPDPFWFRFCNPVAQNPSAFAIATIQDCIDRLAAQVEVCGTKKGILECGRGDRRTKKGKRFIGSFGKARVKRKESTRRLKSRWELPSDSPLPGPTEVA